MPRSVTRAAYAKVNLFLDVRFKRSDGYHELETLFERVGLSDRLTVERTTGSALEFSCSSAEVPRDASNLVVRAAELYRQRSGWREGIRIILEKAIPAGAGLGGGSSNAAATLLALQGLSDSALPPQGLLDCAKRLGADVPFFLADSPWAIGRGRGDEIAPLNLSAQLWHLLVTPDFPIPTTAVYGGLRLTPQRPDVTLLLRALDGNEIRRVRDLLFNALEPTVEALYPAIRGVKAALRGAGAVCPCVSGSGSTVFALCDSRGEAERLLETVRRAGPSWRVCVASTA